MGRKSDCSPAGGKIEGRKKREEKSDAFTVVVTGSRTDRDQRTSGMRI
jgi:hypothetical protein